MGGMKSKYPEHDLVSPGMLAYRDSLDPDDPGPNIVGNAMKKRTREMRKRRRETSFGKNCDEDISDEEDVDSKKEGGGVSEEKRGDGNTESDESVGSNNEKGACGVENHHVSADKDDQDASVEKHGSNKKKAAATRGKKKSGHSASKHRKTLVTENIGRC